MTHNELHNASWERVAREEVPPGMKPFTRLRWGSPSRKGKGKGTLGEGRDQAFLSR